MPNATFFDGPFRHGDTFYGLLNGRPMRDVTLTTETNPDTGVNIWRLMWGDEELCQGDTYERTAISKNVLNNLAALCPGLSLHVIGWGENNPIVPIRHGVEGVLSPKPKPEIAVKKTVFDSD